MERAKADGPRVTARRIAATWLLDREASPHYPRCAGIAGKSSQSAILAGPEATRDLFSRQVGVFMARG